MHHIRQRQLHFSGTQARRAGCFLFHSNYNVPVVIRRPRINCILH
jgi:hypothetical protein